jgi:hypothetical protein
MDYRWTLTDLFKGVNSKELGCFHLGLFEESALAIQQVRQVARFNYYTDADGIFIPTAPSDILLRSEFEIDWFYEKLALGPKEIFFLASSKEMNLFLVEGCGIKIHVFNEEELSFKQDKELLNARLSAARAMMDHDPFCIGLKDGRKVWPPFPK